MHPRARFIEIMRSHPFQVPIKHSDYEVTGSQLYNQLNKAGIRFARWIKRRTKVIEPTFIYGFKTEAERERFKNHLNSLFPLDDGTNQV